MHEWNLPHLISVRLGKTFSHFRANSHSVAENWAMICSSWEAFFLPQTKLPRREQRKSFNDIYSVPAFVTFQARNVDIDQWRVCDWWQVTALGSVTPTGSAQLRVKRKNIHKTLNCANAHVLLHVNDIDRLITEVLHADALQKIYLSEQVQKRERGGEERERQTDRQTDRQRHRQTQRDTETEIETYRQRDRDRDRQTEGQR